MAGKLTHANSGLPFTPMPFKPEHGRMIAASLLSGCLSAQNMALLDM